jgi:hypothetical protein
MKQSWSRVPRWLLFAALVGLIAVPAQGVEQPPGSVSQEPRLSQSVLVRQWLARSKRRTRATSGPLPGRP